MILHKSIDTLPVNIYWDIIEKGDLTGLIISKPWYLPPYTKKALGIKLFAAWDAVEGELYDQLAKDPEFIEDLEQQRRDLLRKIDAVLTKNPIAVLKWEATKSYQDEIIGPAPFDFHKSLSILEKSSAGIAVLVANEKLTVRKYLIHMQLAKQDGKKN